MSRVSFRSLFSPKGRISRRQYWKIVLALSLISAGLVYAHFYLYWNEGIPGSVLYGLLVEFLFLPLAVILILTMAKRLHDIGVSGLWALACLLLFNLTIFVLGVLPSSKSSNKWGEPVL
jgi:uncharacterized membrane protein YhaH (DUF805 family)